MWNNERLIEINYHKMENKTDEVRRCLEANNLARSSLYSIIPHTFIPLYCIYIVIYVFTYVVD